MATTSRQFSEAAFAQLGTSQQLPSMMLGGQPYIYTDQDWQGSDEALADAIAETAEAARSHLVEAMTFYAGLKHLTDQASPVVLASLAAGYPFLVSLIAHGKKLTLAGAALAPGMQHVADMFRSLPD